MISSILANIYLHYAFDLWSQAWRRKRASGGATVIGYADDIVLGFQDKQEEQAFLHDLRERKRKVELALHPDNTRLIRFGRKAAEQRRKLKQGNPETPDHVRGRLFDFLGFPHFCTRSRITWGGPLK